ncbi:GNAT family N-acetyltransferase [Halalkalibacter urbisdiaboli]|uniref:GNAT family N-acetyltransferase n=1 Tax=Halalkalibacter urbisdiaboli TaxID=1960589 RepID=UPI001FD8C9FD|nr:GNAT family N-acetyltransferase [Halalkalibacter urbisdiaboli]
MRREELRLRLGEINTNNQAEIITRRLRLRKLTLMDVQNVFNVVKHEEVGMWLAIGKGMSLTETTDYVNVFLQHWTRYDFGVWAIIHHSTKEYLGHCGLRYVDDPDGDVEILYALSPEYWGNGFAVEAAMATIYYAFKNLQVNKLTARVKVSNVHSKKVIERLGFNYLIDKHYGGNELSYYELLKTQF